MQKKLTRLPMSQGLVLVNYCEFISKLTGDVIAECGGNNNPFWVDTDKNPNNIIMVDEYLAN